MINKRTPLIILLALLINYGHAQTTPGSTGQDDSHKPNAGKNQHSSGVINVDPFTGVGSANIPIYNYEVDGLGFPIGLSYSARGIRVDEISSSVGLGWDLLAGGSITREVKGFEDEVSSQAYWSVVGDYYTGSLVPGARDKSYADQYYDDKEADIFTINLGGRSIELTFTDTFLHYKTYPQSEIKIYAQTKDWNVGTGTYTNIRDGVKQGIGPNLNTNFLEFIVVDEKGNTFYFTRGDVRFKEYTLSPDLTNYKGNYYATEKWNLTKVVTYGGQQITFEYASKYMEYIESVTEHAYTHQYVFSTDSLLRITPQYWKGNKSHISKVTYPNNTVVTFSLDTNRADCIGNYMLNNIVIENKFDNNVKNTVKYVLFKGMLNSPAYGLTNKGYNYISPVFYSQTLNATIPSGPKKDSLRKLHLNRGLRLYLREVVKYGTDNITTEPYYLLSYDTSNALPYRFSAHKDFYGYYNGVSIAPYIRSRSVEGVEYIDTFHLSIPYHEDPIFTGHLWFPYTNASTAGTRYWGKNRSANMAYTSAYLLTKIQNGCGGSDSLIYKGDYVLSNPDSAYGTMTVPNKVIYKDYGHPGGGPLPPTTIDLGYDIDPRMEYRNENDGLIVSKVISKDGLNNDNNLTTEYTYQSGQRINQGGAIWYFVDPTKADSSRIYPNYNPIPNVYFRGSNHGFSEVTVITKGYNNEQLSKVKYTFSNLTYKNASNKTVSCLLKPTKLNYQDIAPVLKKWRMGNPLQKEEWDENGFLTSLAKYTYDTNTGHTMLLVKDSTVNYIRDRSASVTNNMINVSTYVYNNDGNITTVTSVDSKADTIKQINLFQHTFYSTYYTSTALGKMNGDQVQYQIATQVWRNSRLLKIEYASPKFITSGAIQRFKLFAQFKSNIASSLSYADVYPSTGTGQSPFVPRKVVTYTGTEWPAWLSADSVRNLEKTTEVTRYDTLGNAVEIVGKEPDDCNSSIWDTYNGLCIAKVQNSSYKNIAYTSFEGSYYASGTNDYNKGNWDFVPASIKYYNTTPVPNAITGKYVYEITSANSIIGKPLEAINYKLSFWVNDSTKKPDVKRYNGATYVSTISYTTSSTQVGDWVLYTINFTGVAGQSIRIMRAGSNNVYIDEVRLHPRDAAMSSYAYEPMWGVSSTTDANNYITYFTYDTFGTPLEVKDMRGNIIKSMYSRCHWDDTDNSTNYGPVSPQDPVQ